MYCTIRSGMLFRISLWGVGREGRIPRGRGDLLIHLVTTHLTSPDPNAHSDLDLLRPGICLRSHFGAVLARQL